MFNEHPIVNWVGNIAAVTTIAGTIVGWLPVFAAIVAIGWYLIQIYESKTFTNWRTKRVVYRIVRTKEHLLAMENYLGSLEGENKKYWEDLSVKTHTLLNEIRKLQDK